MLNWRAPSGKTAHKRASAFTLVEVLVVVVVIGIGLAITVPNLFISDEERVRQEAERLMAIIEKTRDQAAFSGYAIAMRLGEHGIEFLERDPNSIEPKWLEATNTSLKPRLWRDGVSASLALSTMSAFSTMSTNDTSGRRADVPQVVTFLPAGIGVPFTVRVASKDHTRVIVGDALGNVSFAAPLSAK